METPHRKKLRTSPPAGSSDMERQVTFLDLPLEIRHTILRPLLTTDDPIRPRMTTTTWDVDDMRRHPLTGAEDRDPRKDQDPKKGLQPQLLRLNRQLCDENSRLLYGSNTFLFKDVIQEYDSYGYKSHCRSYRHQWPFYMEVHDFKIFLDRIGAENRLLLRRLTFEFSMGHTLGRALTTGAAKKKEPLMRSRFMGQSFADGFRLLSQGHNLLSLHLNFIGYYMPTAMLRRKGLLETICLIRGVPDVQVDHAWEFIDDDLEDEFEAHDKAEMRLREVDAALDAIRKVAPPKFPLLSDLKSLEIVRYRDGHDAAADPAKGDFTTWELKQTITQLVNERALHREKVAEYEAEIAKLSEMLDNAGSWVSSGDSSGESETESCCAESDSQ